MPEPGDRFEERGQSEFLRLPAHKINKNRPALQGVNDIDETWNPTTDA